MNVWRLNGFFFLLWVFFFTSTAFCLDIPIQWDPSSDSRVVGYKIYYGEASRNYSQQIDVGDNTSTTVMGLASGKNYFIAATGYDEFENESGYSSELSLYVKAFYYGYRVIDNGDGTFTLQISSLLEISQEGNMRSTTLNVNHAFDQPIIAKKGFHKYENDTITVIYVVGQSTGTVWAIRESQYGTKSELKTPVVVLQSSGMNRVDDMVVGDFDKSLFDNDGDDVCLIDYQNGRMQFHLYRNGMIEAIPMNDSHPTKGALGTFSGNGAFLRSTVGDFDGDGNDDVLLMAPATGNNVVWLSNGTAIFERYPWCVGGSVNAHPHGIDYDGDGKTDLILVNVVGGAFSAWRSNGSIFNREVVRTFSAAAFSYAIKGDFILEQYWVVGSRKEEFALHAPLTTGNMVIFEYLPSYQGDPDPFKLRGPWTVSSKFFF